MHIACTYRGNEKHWESPCREAIIGRAEHDSDVWLDLSTDHSVSRRHGRIWQEDGQYWIEDLNSTGGTRLNGREIKARGKQRIQAGDVINVGGTALRVLSLDDESNIRETNYLQNGRRLPSEKKQEEGEIDIARHLDATLLEAIFTGRASDKELHRLLAICDLPLKFAAKTELESLLTDVVERLVEIIPSGESWAIVLREPSTGALLLKAYHHHKQPYLSETLARRAMTEGKAFIWKLNAKDNAIGSILHKAMVTGIYTPMLWQGEPLGVICAGARTFDVNFTIEDLRLATIVAQYAAMAVASHNLQEQLRRETTTKANLLRQFSPKVAERLLACKGRMRLGGQRNEVTILIADIRGFMQFAGQTDPDDVIDMLNDYFAVIVPVIFNQGGTIDKFMGDAILAVFGSPEPDPKQHENALAAAVGIQEVVSKLNDARKARGSAIRKFGIGIHSGDVVHGFVGNADHMEFTVISDAVNRAARYCAAAAEGEILISPEVHERVWRIVEVERTLIKTKHEGEFEAYRVIHSKIPGPQKTEKVNS